MHQYHMSDILTNVIILHTHTHTHTHTHRKGEARNLRTQEKIAKRNLLERYNKVQFSQRSIDTWNGLKEGKH